MRGAMSVKNNIRVEKDGRPGCVNLYVFKLVK